MISRFFAWWFGELKACLPGPLANALFGGGSQVEVSLGASEVGFALRRNGSARDLGTVDLEATPAKARERAARRLLGRGGARPGPVTLRLPAGRVLRPKVELPAAAAENLREVLAFEMDRYTPFPADEVLFDFRVGGSDPELERLNIQLLVARRKDVDEAVALARSFGLAAARIAGPAGGSGGGAAEGFNLLPPAQRRRPSRALPRLVGAMLVVTLGLAAADYWLAYDRKLKTLDLFEARLAELRRSTGETGQLEDKIARLTSVAGYLVEKKRHQPLTVEVLDDITRRLPDAHYLISYVYRDGSVQLGGYSDDPSSMLRLLEESDLLSEARFASPVTMDTRVGKERFNLVAKVAREGAK